MNELQAIKEIVKANATAVYQDSTQPSVRVLGKSLAQCVSLFATPIGKMAEIFEKNLTKYIDKLEGLSDVQIKEPETRILVPILERLRYTDDEVVADYYAQILATASTTENANKVSVAFIEILNRLCADEIKILEFINSHHNTLILEKETGEEYQTSFFGVLPVMNVHINQKDGGYVVAIKNLTYLLEKIKLNNADNLNMYFDNMFALGLLLKPAMIRANDNNIYLFLKKNIQIKQLEAQIVEGQKLDFSEARIETTELGKQLLSIASYNKK
ncbi:MAG: Abi-alpha family protein [Lutibacter sp.]|nr:Abi-alpha family protein [Lutibacter sp.]